MSATSFNRVGNAPGVEWREKWLSRTTRGALPTRLNEYEKFPHTVNSSMGEPYGRIGIGRPR